jgi:glutamyl-tRNA synthetase
MTCRTRFAPSPTGFLHIGGARTALFCWLEARRRHGRFILRIEDTDRERSTQESVQAILDGMQWLDLGWDEGPVFQTQRFDRYRQVAEDLVRAGKAYYAYETKEELDAMRERQMAAGLKPRYDGYWRERQHEAPPAGRPRVIRFKNPQGGSVVWNDLVKGRIEISNDELDDLIIWRSDDHPTYNFAVVCDDVDMKITDVVRGDDHVNNTPRQINIYAALGAPQPAFAHLPMIHGPDGTKLSKRHGAVSVMQYRDDGYLPHALLNYIVRLGWSHGDQEIFSREEMVRLFKIEDVNASAARFDFEKLAWVNQHYLKNDAPESLVPHFEWHLRAAGCNLSRGPRPADVIVALRDRVKTLKEMAERARVWYEPLAAYDEAAVAKHFGGRAREALVASHQSLAALGEDAWRPEAIDAAIKAAAAAIGEGVGKVAQPLRVAMTGTAVSPSIEHTVYLAGRDEALRRIDQALARIGGA